MKALIIASLFLTSMVYSQAPTARHYQNPFKNNCASDEVHLGDNSKATCSRNCNTYACPTDYPSSGHGLTPTCLPPNAYGNRQCALVCPTISWCPSGSRCTKLTFAAENLGEKNQRDRVLQSPSRSVNVCLYSNDYLDLLPGVIAEEVKDE